MADTEKKGFFQKPESITTLLTFAVIGVVGFLTLDQVLPIVNRVLDYALETTIKTVALGGLLTVIVGLAVSKEWHKLGWYGYQMAMRWITSWVVELDPIAIMKSFIKQLKGNREDLAKSLATLMGQEKKLLEMLATNEKTLTTNQGRAVAAHKQSSGGKDSNMQMQFVLYARKAGRLEESKVTFQGLLNTIRKHIAVTKKILEASDFMIADIEDTVQVETEKRNMIRASYKAMSAAKRILKENAQREMYDLALESVTKDYFNKLGEMEQFMDDSRSFVNTMDLDNNAFEADALSKIEEWDKRSSKLLEGGTGTTKYRVPGLEEPEEEVAATTDTKRQSYADLYDTK